MARTRWDAAEPRRWRVVDSDQIVAPDLAAIAARLRAAGCVYADDEARLLAAAAPTPDAVDALVARRVEGAPLEHVIGWAEFCGLRIEVGPGVFVPRRRSELLVRQAAILGRATTDRPCVVVDLCCGSGALGVALAAALPLVELHAVDIDPAAVRDARRNIGHRGHGYLGDLDAPLPPRLCGHVDLLLANAPYVPTDALASLPAEARVHEPRGALDGGADGLDTVRRVVALAPHWLAPRGHLLIETSARQAAQVCDAVALRGLVARVVRSDQLDATVVIGARPDRRRADGERP